MSARIRTTLLAALFALPCIASAETAAHPKIDLSGTLWGLWGYDLGFANPDAPLRAGSHRFEVTRSYVNFRAQLSDSISLRITPDLVVTTRTDGNVDGSLLLRLKYAYLTFDALPGLSVRALMQPTPYIGFSDQLWGYRVLGTDILEHFTGIRSADTGVAVLGQTLANFLSYEVLASNGEGFSQQERVEPDAARYKDVAARVTLSPFAQAGPLLRDLSLSLFGQYGIREKVPALDAHLERTRAMALLAWRGPGFTLGVGGGHSADDRLEEGREVRRESFLWTSWGWVDLPLRLRAIGRFDLCAPTNPADGDPGRRTRLVAGLAHLFTDAVQLILNWERNGYQTPQNAPLDAPGDTLFVRVAADF